MWTQYLSTHVLHGINLHHIIISFCFIQVSWKPSEQSFCWGVWRTRQITIACAATHSNQVSRWWLFMERTAKQSLYLVKKPDRLLWNCFGMGSFQSVSVDFSCTACHPHWNFIYLGVRCGSVVKCLHMVWWVIGSILHGGPIELLLVPASAPQLVYQRSRYVLSCLWGGANRKVYPM